MQPIVSVIIPIYNVENYIVRCVESVRNQTLSDIEIILVDDESPDNCPVICDDYAKKDNRIRVVHKQNGGLASARNAGMNIAKGKYIFFVDSDDWIDYNALSELVEIANKYSVDWVRFRPMYAGWPDKKDGSLCDFGTENGMAEGIYNRQKIVDEIYPRLFATPQLTLGVVVAAWRSLYRHQFIKQNNLYFNDEVRYSEDTIFSANVVTATNSFYYLDGARYYHYFFNPTSITKSFKKDRWDSCKKLISCFENDFRNCTDYDYSDQLWLQKIYCILSAMGQKNMIQDKKQKKAYIKSILCDPISIEALKHIDLVDTSWKLKFKLLLYKSRIMPIIVRL